MYLIKDIKDYKQSQNQADRMFFLRCLKTIQDIGLYILTIKNVDKEIISSHINLIQEQIKNFKLYKK